MKCAQEGAKMEACAMLRRVFVDVTHLGQDSGARKRMSKWNASLSVLEMRRFRVQVNDM